MEAPNPVQKGKKYENAARLFLEAKGFIFIKSNYRCYQGEIDLIMQDQEDIVFVEVRGRTKTDYGTALESIDKNKITRLLRAAKHYLQAKKCLYKVNSRFDIIAIHPIQGITKLEWFKNAFTIDRYW